MNVLVTGGAGFIGSHLVEKLLAAGHRTIVVDNESSGLRQYVPADAIYYNLDICDERLRDVIKEEKPEIIVHLAAQSVVPVSVRDPALDAQINIQGLIGLLEAARQQQVRKVIYASTAAVYGEPASVPIVEEMAGHLLSPYAVSKYAGEGYLAAYHHLYGIAYTAFRFANVYGPRQLAKSDGGVVAIFTELIRYGKTLTINGDGEQTRDFIFVGDVTDAMIRAFDKADNQVLNLSTGLPTSINQLIDELEQVARTRVAREYGPPRPGDIRHSCLSNEKMKQQLAWEPRYTLRQGLAATWEGYELEKPPGEK
ncbi:NAD-dependent epimerase/dehydratase family protein [Brevibacillus humidisoli]|uniref:NAD-dependent epimerase/dehydratase family protein n=1 Tax=Brevibacillus humidisoli TaxID=2895522 RepID=UPI001E65894B|nr:NAD-dependent epimerase/dehydratase family protein [Brevibacillus humidisoli]UFJ39156.1 NAD-dependent epimerase/dehydratase family protein [Brevibacillus humidisoli]